MTKHWTMVAGTIVAGALLLLGGAGGCGGSDDNSGGGDGGGATDGGGDAATAPAPAECKPASADPQVVKLQTDDGVELEADLYLAGRASAPAVVLLHMVPPANTRSNYPRPFIDALVGRGITVLNVDRRGAGNSGGVATEAYQGPNGKLDAKAAHDFLRGNVCPVDAERIVYIGASNGTTTVVDFALLAQSRAAIARVKGLVLISGGAYTDAQTSITKQRKLYEMFPMLFIYGGADPQSVGWNEALEAAKAPSWEFRRYEGPQHGTELFAAQPELIELIAAFVGKL